METVTQIEGPALMALKIAILIFIFLYILFSIIVIRQVRAMTEALRVGFENPIKLVAILHFIFSVCVFILALILL